MSKKQSQELETESDWEIVEPKDKNIKERLNPNSASNAAASSKKQEDEGTWNRILGKSMDLAGNYYGDPRNYFTAPMKHVPALAKGLYEGAQKLPDIFSKMLESAPKEIEGVMDNPDRIGQNITTGLAQMGHNLINAPRQGMDFMAENGGFIYPSYLKGVIPQQEEHDFHSGSAQAFGDLFGNIEERRKIKPGDELVAGLTRHVIDLMGGSQLTKTFAPEALKAAKIGGEAVLKGGKAAVGAGEKATKWTTKQIADAFEATKRQLGKEGPILEDMAAHLSPEEIPKTLSTIKAAKKEGIQLTPGEASGNPFLMEMEAEASSSPKGRKEMYDFKQKRKVETERAVNDFVDDISTNTAEAPKKIRQASEDIIKEKKTDRVKRSEPYYEASERDVVTVNQLNNYMRDPILKEAFGQMLKDPAFQRGTRGYPPGSIKRIDEVKKWLWDRAERLRKQGETNAAAQYDSARRKLLKSADKASPTYKKAREIYSEDSPAIQKLEESPLGKIAQYDDSQLSKLSETLFNPKETNPQVFKDIQTELMRHDPQAWYDLVAHDVKRRLNSSNLFQKGKYGEAFYRELGQNPEMYRMYLDALKHNPPLLKRFKNFISVFENMETNFRMTPKVEGSVIDLAVKKPVKWTAEKLSGLKNSKRRKIMTKGDQFGEILRNKK